MMYNNADQKVEDMYGLLDVEGINFRMARVMQITSGRPEIRFNGEVKNSQKLYKYLASYSPAIGDKVILAKVGRTYVILGKVV